MFSTHNPYAPGKYSLTPCAVAIVLVIMTWCIIAMAAGIGIIYGSWAAAFAVGGMFLFFFGAMVLTLFG